MVERDRKPRWGLWTVALLLALAALYPLSVGPAVWLADRGLLPEGSQIIYAPVKWAVIQNDAIGDAVSWYVSLWGGPPP